MRIHADSTFLQRRGLGKMALASFAMGMLGTSPGVQAQGLAGSPAKPQGHGFIAATSINRAGY